VKIQQNPGKIVRLPFGRSQTVGRRPRGIIYGPKQRLCQTRAQMNGSRERGDDKKIATLNLKRNYFYRRRSECRLDTRKTPKCK
jgi:hypothetical protein